MTPPASQRRRLFAFLPDPAGGQAGRQGLWAPESVPHRGVSFFACTKTTPTYPLRGEENFLVEEEQLQMKQTMLTPEGS